MTKIIMINGKQGSGKSTLAKGLVRHFTTHSGSFVEIVSFAAPLKRMQAAVGMIGREYGLPVPAIDGPLMQVLGTEWGRKNYGENVWVDAAKARIKQCESDDHDLIVIIDDLRFLNEFSAFPEAFKIRLEAPEEVRKLRAEKWRPNTDHPSETNLDGLAHEFNLVIPTHTLSADGTLQAVIESLKVFYPEKVL